MNISKLALLRTVTLSLLGGCVMATTGPAEENKELGVSSLDEAHTSIGALYWTGELWQGERHDTAAPVCQAVLIAPELIVSGSRRGEHAGCAPKHADFPGTLEFRIAGEQAIVREVATRRMIMGGRLDRALTATPMPARLVRGDLYGAYDVVLSLHAGNGADLAHQFAEPLAERRNEPNFSFSLSGFGWNSCPEGGFLPGGAIFGVVEGRVWLLGILEGDPSCNHRVQGIEAAQTTELMGAYRSLRGPWTRASERYHEHSYGSFETRCNEEVALMMRSVSELEAAEVVDECDAAFGADPEGWVQCLSLSALSQHPMGRVVRSCADYNPANERRLGCISTGARAPHALFECCHQQHRTDDGDFVSCLESNTCSS